MNDWPSDRFSEIAGWSAIFGLLASCFSIYLVIALTRTAAKMQRSLQQRVQLPKLVNGLHEDVDRLAKYVGELAAYPSDLIPLIGAMAG